MSSPKQEAEGKSEAKENKKSGEFTMEEVAKHTSESDVWVVVEDQVRLLLALCLVVSCISIDVSIGPRCHQVPS